MRLLKCILPPDHDLIPMGDTHEGALAQYTNGVNKVIDTIQSDKNTYWTHGGDALESLMVTHPYYDPRTLMKDDKGNPSLPLTQAYNVIEQFRPIKDKCLAILQGNHELRLWSFGDITGHICRTWEKPEIYGGYICKLSVYIKTRAKEPKLGYKALIYHGKNIPDSRAGSEKQKRTNREAALMRILAPLAGDCAIMIMHHTHRLIVSKPLQRLYLTDHDGDLHQNYITSVQNAPYIEPESRYYINGGSFYRSQMVGGDTYAEIRGYPPTELGYPIIRVRDGRIFDVEPIVI